MSLLNRISFLKVMNSYVFWLAQVVIIRLNMKKIKIFTAAINGLTSKTYNGKHVKNTQLQM